MRADCQKPCFRTAQANWEVFCEGWFDARRRLQRPAKRRSLWKQGTLVGQIAARVRGNDEIGMSRPHAHVDCKPILALRHRRVHPSV
eukprot:2913822-Pleurochrysis_carterae.AAC.1